MQKMLKLVFIHCFLLFSCVHPLASKPLRILFYTFAFPDFIHPFITNQMIGFIERGHDVTILAPTSSPYATHFSALSAFPKELAPEIGKYRLLERTYYKELPHNKRRYDLILCEQGTFGEKVLKYRDKHLIQGKIITFFRGKDITMRLDQKPNRYQVLFERGELFLPVCKKFKDVLTAHGCAHNKIIVLHSAIDCGKFKFRERTIKKTEPIRIVTAGRLVEKKGTEYAIRAVAEIAKRHSNVELLIIGGGPEEAKLKHLINHLNAHNNVKMLGWKSQEEMVSILDQCHIFIFPAITAHDKDQEGIPNVVKEAMAMGLPVISTWHSGIPECVKHGETGFLVEEKDVHGLVSRIQYLLDHPTIVPRMGRAGRKRIENDFNMEKENHKLIRICELVAANNWPTLRKEFM